MRYLARYFYGSEGEGPAAPRPVGEGSASASQNARLLRFFVSSFFWVILSAAKEPGSGILRYSSFCSE